MLISEEWNWNEVANAAKFEPRWGANDLEACRIISSLWKKILNFPNFVYGGKVLTMVVYMHRYNDKLKEKYLQEQSRGDIQVS